MRRFKNRQDAGRALADALRTKGYTDPVVLGIPRGGVPVAAEVATALGGTLSVVVARKLRAPGQPELAIGAVTADGSAWINEEIADAAGTDSRYLEREQAAQVAEARHREELFDGHRRPPVEGRVVIIVDDGLATGATAIAAARSMRAGGAARVILAVPVAPPGSVRRLQAEVDEVVCPRQEEDFWAIGEFYDDFRQVDDREVKAILDRWAAASTETREARARRDGIELAARLRLPGGNAPYVTFVHGLGSSKDSPRNVVIAERLVDEGIATVLFDLNGHGDSTRDRSESLATYVRDLAAVEAWARTQPGIDASRHAIAGSSMGATIALAAVLEGSAAADALVLRAPPIGAEDYRGLSTPTLLIVGSRDSLVVDAREAARVCPAVELHVVEGATHLFEEEGTLEEATALTTSWLAEKLRGRGPDA
jgi:predicted phosphoribosyltransferase/alpha-beta hydrolase superfamily lysophospholipase